MCACVSEQNRKKSLSHGGSREVSRDVLVGLFAPPARPPADIIANVRRKKKIAVAVRRREKVNSDRSSIEHYFKLVVSKRRRRARESGGAGYFLAPALVLGGKRAAASRAAAPATMALRPVTTQERTYNACYVPNVVGAVQALDPSLKAPGFKV